jgi:SH3-like domain-containing protein
VEFVLALIGALLGAALTISGKQRYGAWVAVVTTISGALAAHVLAQRYEQLTINYRANADRLAGFVARWTAKNDASLAELVEPYEAVLLEENQGWIAGDRK